MEKQFGSPWAVLVSAVIVACVVAPERVPPRTPKPARPAHAVAFEVPVAPASPSPPPPAPACPAGMVLIDGDACPKVEQTCLRWVDPPSSPYHYTRCAEFGAPKCLAPREHRRYCIDRDEYLRPPETVPMVHASFVEAEALCAERGARLCTEPEWEFACEGEAMLPYPYGRVRDSTACNFDRTDLGKPNEGLIDHRAPLTAFPRCVSPFGVHDLVGNVDEWTEREGVRAPHRAALHGGWWLPGRNNCFAATLGHAEEYRGSQVGFRCCRAAD